jgi:NAD(P)H-flavin reductase
VSSTPFARRRLTVTGADDLGAYRVLRVADPQGPPPQPGQFTMLAAAERWGGGEDERPYLPRALSVARYSEGECHYLLEDVGPGTRRLCELDAGDEVLALGPLGRGFDGPPPGRRAVLVGGGVGIAPLAILQDALEGGGVGATVLLGFRDRARAEGAALLRDARLATDDGSVGHRGLLTDLLASELAQGSDAVVYSCGPAAMLEAVRRLAPHAQLACEAPMACGYGACYGCAVEIDGELKRLCVEGPVLVADRWRMTARKSTIASERADAPQALLAEGGKSR